MLLSRLGWCGRVTQRLYSAMASSLSSGVTLHTSATMPTLGLGTWAPGSPAERASALEGLKAGLKVAVEAGYRHIDTAWSYQNEAAIGEALQVCPTYRAPGSPAERASALEGLKAGLKVAVEAGYRHIDTAWSYQNEAAIGEALQVCPTYRAPGSPAERASALEGLKAGLKVAVEAGYRHIDTAWSYQNEAAIGEALQVCPTYRAPGSPAERASALEGLKAGLKVAVEAGYRHIDTAWSYQNEAAIGEALQVCPTYRAPGSPAERASALEGLKAGLKVAVEAGYRHIDTAWSYQNEAAIGEALQVCPTYRAPGSPAERASALEGLKAGLKVAVEAGYRHIDTAWSYQNEAAIGEALQVCPTYRAPGSPAERASALEGLKAGLKVAVEAGYRHIDTAWSYQNEAAIGEALQVCPTYRAPGSPAERASALEGLKAGLKVAVEAGYRHIDTAWSYQNEAAIGEALQVCPTYRAPGSPAERASALEGLKAGLKVAVEAGYRHIDTAWSYQKEAAIGEALQVCPTYRAPGSPAERASALEGLKAGLKVAVEEGYRHIDTAWSYQNEAAIGEALQELYDAGVVKRSELFITTKLWAFHHSREAVEPTLRQQLKDLRTDYVDMYLIHAPIPFEQDPARPDVPYPFSAQMTLKTKDTPHLETWRAMEECVAKGLAKHIGVSNFNSKQIQRLLDQGNVPVANLQVECHPFRPQTELKAYCDSRNIAFTCYSPLGSPAAAASMSKMMGLPTPPSLMASDEVNAVAKAHGKSPAQVLVRFALDRGMIVIPKSTNPERIKANADVFDFHLQKDEIASLVAMGRERMIDVFAWGKAHPEYPFNEPF